MWEIIFTIHDASPWKICPNGHIFEEIELFSLNFWEFMIKIALEGYFYRIFSPFHVVFVWKSIFHGFHGNPWILRIKCPKFANLGQILLEICSKSLKIPQNGVFFVDIASWILQIHDAHTSRNLWFRPKISHFWLNLRNIVINLARMG